MSQDGLIQIRVFGDPQPFPKKDIGILKRPGMEPRLVPVDKDYRTQTDPLTRKVKKYDKGYKRAWMAHVAETVDKYMFDNNLKPFPKNHPVAMGLLFYLPKSKSCKLEFPSQAPDLDNLDYAVWNALKRTPKKKGRDGKYPNGILFYDDDQIITRLAPSGKNWASENDPPGVLISVLDIEEMIRTQMDMMK